MHSFEWDLGQKREIPFELKRNPQSSEAKTCATCKKEGNKIMNRLLLRALEKLEFFEAIENSDPD